MRWIMLAAGLLAVTAAVPAAAQSPPAPAVVRTVAAAAKLPDLGTAPLSFCAVEGTIPAGAASRIAAPPQGIFYQLAGSTEVSAAGETKTLAPGEALVLVAGREVSLKAAGDGPSRALHFLLLPTTALGQPVETAPAAVAELYRTPMPIPDLKPGAYDLNLTRVTFPPGMPSNPPHHRSGAALYYIVSGSGANTIAGNTVQKGPGALVYEPSSVIHQWGNPGSDPLTFLAFNINPDGVPAVVMEAAPK